MIVAFPSVGNTNFNAPVGNALVAIMASTAVRALTRRSSSVHILALERGGSAILAWETFASFRYAIALCTFAVHRVYRAILDAPFRLGNGSLLINSIDRHLCFFGPTVVSAPGGIFSYTQAAFNSSTEAILIAPFVALRVVRTALLGDGSLLITSIDRHLDICID